MSDNGHLPLTVMALTICVFVQSLKGDDNMKPWQRSVNEQIQSTWVTMRSPPFCHQQGVLVSYSLTLAVVVLPEHNREGGAPPKKEGTSHAGATNTVPMP